MSKDPGIKNPLPTAESELKKYAALLKKLKKKRGLEAKRSVSWLKEAK